MKTYGKRMVLATVLVLSAMSLNACSSNAGTGAVVGAIAGSAIGKTTGNYHDSRAAIGALVGAAAGAVVGSRRDVQEYQNRNQRRYQQPRYYQRRRY